MAVSRITKGLAEARKVPVYVYTVAEAADVLRVSKFSIYKWINEGVIASLDLSESGRGNRKVRITAEALNDFLISKRMTGYGKQES